MNICFVLTSLGYGGAERVISILSDELVKRGHSISICLTDQNPKISYQINEKIHIANIVTGRFFDELFLSKSKAAFINYFSTEKPDIVLTFTNGPGAIIAPICKKLNIIYIHSERNDPQRINSSIGLKLRWRKLVKNTNYVVFQTKGAMKLYPNRIQEKSTIILNPFDTANLPAYYTGERKKEMVSVGRLTVQKRQDVLIKAFSIIVKSFPEYSLKIYGSGELEDDYIELIKSLGLEKSVFLMGNSSNIFGEINESAIFVLSSDFEGLPNALIEAMSMGLPCVSTKCSPGGAEEIIQNGVNGRLVDCNNPNDMATTVCEMLGDYEKSLQLGLEARKIVDRLSNDKIVDEWESYLYKCLKFPGHN